MDRESFLDTLKQQYADEIREAYIECEHGTEGQVDFAKFNQLVNKLMTTAKAEGLPGKDFEDLLKSTVPDALGKVQLKKAA